MIGAEMRRVAEEVLASRSHRRAALLEVRGSVVGTLNGHREERLEGTRSLRRALAMGRHGLRRMIASETVALRRARRAAGMEMRARLDLEADTRRREVRQGLSAGRQQRMAAAFRQRQQRQGAFRALRQGVARHRGALRADLAEARVAWSMTAPPASAAALPMSAGSTADALQPDLAARVFAHLAEHPDGVRALELEGKLGAARSAVMQALRSLVAEGRVRREGGVYVAR